MLRMDSFVRNTLSIFHAEHMVQTLILVFYVAGFATVLAHQCHVPLHAISTLQFFRFLCDTTLFAWMPIAVGLMRVWIWQTSDLEVGIGDVQLVADAPRRVQFRQALPAILVFSIILLISVASWIYSLVNPYGNVPAGLGGCPSTSELACPVSSQELLTVLAPTVVILAFFFVHWRQTAAAMRDQQKLPMYRYKMSLIFVRNQRRYGRVLFGALVVSDVILELSTLGSCSGYVYAKVYLHLCFTFEQNRE